MAADTDFKLETYEEYHGSAEEVKSSINNCLICGSKLMLTHLPDYKNLLIQETSRCLDCGCSNKKKIHILN